MDVIFIKDLPRVYVNPIDKEINNYQSIASSNDFKKSLNRSNLSMKLKSIFNSNNYIYKKRVRITLKDKVVEKVIVGKANGYLLFIDNSKIKLSDIYDIEIA